MKTMEEMKNHYSSFDSWILSLKQMRNEEWFQPIQEGKWSAAEIVSHLIAWDRFTLDQRLGKLKENAVLDPFPDFQSVNDRAAEYAKSGITKDELIAEFMEVRSAAVDGLLKFEGEELQFHFKIGDHPFTIASYMEDFIGHDLHHKAQIDAFLEKTKAPG
ncbi:DinB family protein [Peribacillus frigoritolerans]|uniref:DinB family protein n=1 Tax=Peribacillus frigoritolerans TaxID=450367 RepID=UPI00105A8168|nr:DinB family protein [Peribacillus frigoritolerans]TDL80143.1 DinB family protein [Peribacillus frigoritolerans]